MFSAFFDPIVRKNNPYKLLLEFHFWTILTFHGCGDKIYEKFIETILWESISYI